MPVHPGAAAFYEGMRESFLDRWGNSIFLAPMVLARLPQFWRQRGNSSAPVN